ncbi:SGNH/GDSL hydrolase family protein [Algoriphagus sp. SE2]|uniref:SGNH/GDSL hydrolase family protein n=1 Tax=Algoriphagus sp. SE2 TaxID=3141536 RepID=UPI0031CD5F4A
MKTSLLLFAILCLVACQETKKETGTENEMDENYNLTYLALGDSYTIGEGVEESKRYPNQLVALLNKSSDVKWDNPRIIAKTGWTVDELEEGINNAALVDDPYDLVTLLIGVNDQYRGGSLSKYEVDFEKMLLRAIGFAGNLPDHVVVISIPDWGVTPFASQNGKNSAKVAEEITAFNQAKEAICEKYGVTFIDITTDYRIIGGEPEMIVEDQLHPSGLVYKTWAEALFDTISKKEFE